MSVIERAHVETKADRARQRATMLEIQRRLIAHLAAGRTTDFAAAPYQVAARVFTDPTRLEAERRELFLKLPMLAAFTSDMPNPGDVVVFEAAGPSILIARGRDGQVRAFLNRCSHRAAKLTKGCSKARLLTCPFHGWSYDLQGRLVGLPGEAAFADLDRATLGLTPVPAAEWCGLIFVKAHPGEEEIDVEGYLGPLAPELRQLDIAHTAPVRKHRIDLEANWKFAQDTFFEGYHFATVHPQTIAQTAISNVMVHDEFGPHQRVMMASQGWVDYVGHPEGEWRTPPYEGIHLIFPNTIFYSGHADRFAGSDADRQIFGCWRSFPGATPGESFTLMATYRPKDADEPEDVAFYEQVSDFIMKVVETEDYSLCAEAQANLETGPADAPIVFGRNECANQAIHQRIAEAVGEVG